MNVMSDWQCDQCGKAIIEDDMTYLISVKAINRRNGNSHVTQARLCPSCFGAGINLDTLVRRIWRKNGHPNNNK